MNARRFGSVVSGSWSARTRSCSSWPAETIASVAQRHVQAVAVPRARAAAVHLRAGVGEGLPGAGDRVGVGHEVAAAALEGRVEQPDDRLERKLPRRLIARRPAG